MIRPAGRIIIPLLKKVQQIGLALHLAQVLKYSTRYNTIKIGIASEHRPFQSREELVTHHDDDEARRLPQRSCTTVRSLHFNLV